MSRYDTDPAVDWAVALADYAEARGLDPEAVAKRLWGAVESAAATVRHTVGSMALTVAEVPERLLASE